MEKIFFTKKLLESFETNGLSNVINSDSADKMFKFAEILKETNEKFNLTAITDDDGIILKHFTDCATVIKYIPSGANIIDIGCGAGFPSMPIAILRQDVNVTSLDSTSKKINFINETASELGLNNIKGIVSRAEDHAKEKREHYDIAISRAVARLNILGEICIPLVKTGGLFIAMKASRGDEEYEEAKKGIELLGAGLDTNELLSLQYNNSVIEREIFVFKKAKQTPAQYPRNYSQISKKPL